MSFFAGLIVIGFEDFDTQIFGFSSYLFFSVAGLKEL
jgi:hypothetical protein